MHAAGDLHAGACHAVPAGQHQRLPVVALLLGPHRLHRAHDSGRHLVRSPSLAHMPGRQNLQICPLAQSCVVCIRASVRCDVDSAGRTHTSDAMCHASHALLLVYELRGTGYICHAHLLQMTPKRVLMQEWRKLLL